MPHPDPIPFLQNWKKRVVMPITDGTGGVLFVTVTKKNLIRQIAELDLDVEFRTSYPEGLYVYLRRKGESHDHK